MIKKNVKFWTVMFCVVVMPTSVRALIVEGDTPQRHNRFYVGSDKAFLGDAYDFSGAGIADNGRFATLISPSYFLTATHSRGRTLSTVNFFHTNDPDGPSDQRTIIWGQQIDGTDIWLGKVSQPVSSNVMPFAIPLLDQPNDYLGQEVVSTGVSTVSPAKNNVKVGRNETSSFLKFTLNASTGNTITTVNNGALGFNPDESQVEGGDSGAPVFMAFGGQLSLVGIHWAKGSITSIDSFVPDYFDSIQTIVQANGESLSTIPEPTTLAMFTLLAATFGWSRRAA